MNSIYRGMDGRVGGQAVHENGVKERVHGSFAPLPWQRQSRAFQKRGEAPGLSPEIERLEGRGNADLTGGRGACGSCGWDFGERGRGRER